MAKDVFLSSSGEMESDEGGDLATTTYTQTYSTANRTVAAPTAAALTLADGVGTNDGTIGAITADASVKAAIQELAAAINALIADDLDNRQTLTALIDDLQALGLVN